VAYATLAELAAALRITTLTPEVEARLQACLDAAAVEIDDALCRTAEDPVEAGNPLVNRVNLMRAVEWYKANDAAFGILGSDENAMRLPKSTFARHAVTLTPLRTRWGIA
jgi:hypothetical protein